jgi:hypothetical protein
MLYTKERMKMQELVRLSGSHDPPKLCPDCSRGPSTRRQETVNSPCRANSPIGSLWPRLQHLRHERSDPAEFWRLGNKLHCSKIYLCNVTASLAYWSYYMSCLRSLTTTSRDEHRVMDHPAMWRPATPLPRLSRSDPRICWFVWGR